MNEQEQFISSIAQNSFSVQAGNAQAEVIKLQADLASERISGPALREYIVQASKTDAAIQGIINYFYKWSAQLLSVINRLIEAAANWVKDWFEYFDKKLTEFLELIKQAALQAAGKFGGIWARMAVDEFFKTWFAAKAAEDNVPDAVVDFFSTGISAEMLEPVRIPTPFDVRL